jgi:hypothetical protein
MHYEQEQAVRRWARWAREQATQWPAADDPGTWDAQVALDHLSSGPSTADPAAAVR